MSKIYVHKNVKMAAAAILTVILFYGTFYAYTGYKIGVFEYKVKDYLVNLKKYKEDEILSIQGVRSKGGDLGITIFVEFKDEPGVKYSYKSLSGNIVQTAGNLREGESRRHQEQK
ncbi:hypothetical protein [Paenibacillus sp. MBLB4367]|uniref:hypothetical protein n=1 Tax=Paenibacillus sp. MBLB4367 TaxID=3384767 RepID=UPI0039081D3B